MAILNYDIAGDQIDGSRDYQEDAFLITHLNSAEDDHQALVVVADGMGGHAAGNVASNMAVQAFNKYVSSHFPTDGISSISDILHTSIIKANDALKETIAETAALSGMGCTIVGILLNKGKLWWASVGDSHLYLIRGETITKLNADHSYGAFLDHMAKTGEYVEADPSLSRNMLISVLTGSDITEIDTPARPFELQPGDSLIVASDGLDTLAPHAVITQVNQATDAREAATSLLKAVEDMQSPNQDNTTIINIRASAIEVKLPDHDNHAIPDETDHHAGEDRPSISRFQWAITIIVFVIGIAITDSFMELGIIFPQKPVVTTIPVISKPDGDTPATAVTETDGETQSASTTTQTAEIPPAQTPTEEEKEEIIPVVVPVVKPFSDPMKNGKPGPSMVTVPAGEFMMGAGPLSLNLNERPQRRVTINEFAISQYEITYAQYENFARATGAHLPAYSGDNPQTQPVVEISWHDAQRYAAWLSDQTGHQYHLPTEAQWEYAARAGTTTSYWWGLDAGVDNAYCTGCGSDIVSPRKASPIGRFKANAWGIYDTSGNVAEWVQDCHNPNYSGAPADGTAWLDGDCSRRMTRGGSFSNAGNGITNTSRQKHHADSKLTHLGFRLVREK